MSWSKIYRGEYVDIETDLNNTNIQATKRIDIIDGNSNPYNIAYTSVIIGPNIEFTFTFDTLPAGTTSVAIGYSSDGGQTWNSQTGGFVSPRVITLPYASYIFSFTIHGINETYYEEDEIIELEMTDDPVRDIVIDNDEDKFTPIRARQLEIKVYSSNDVSINKFSQGGDNTFKVNYYIDSVLYFTGFLSLGDLSQEFLPHPNVIKLIATDGLGFLKDIPLTDFDGDNPENENPIGDYLHWALSKTGLQLNLKATFNIREVTALSLSGDATGAGHFFKWCYLDAKTFEDEPGTCINCYDVITAILGEEAFLCQYLGEWRIIRVDEIEHGLSVQTVYQWNWQGNFLGKFEETHEQNVGIGEAYSWMNDDAVVMIDRRVKESRLTYSFETPKEIPCNKDFSRGDIESDTPTVKTYDVLCWSEMKKNLSGGGPPGDCDRYIERLFIDDYETSRYLVITWPPNSTGSLNYTESSPIYVSVKDKFEYSIEYSWASNQSKSGSWDFDISVVRLEGDDGSHWTLDNDGKWYQSDATWSTFFKTLSEQWVPDDIDETEVRTKSVTCDPIPTSGNIILMLYSLNQHPSDGFDDVNIHYNISFDYKPFINGSYGKYTGQQHLVSQTADTRNIREKDVFISDSPKKIFKGALLIEDSGAYPLAGLFYNAAQEPSGPVNEKRYGEIQAFDVWNQYNRNMVKFDGTVDHSNPPPNLITKYFMTDLNENTADRIFLLLHYELDTHLCEWTAFFMEVSKFDTKLYEGHSFKYITE